MIARPLTGNPLIGEPFARDSMSTVLDTLSLTMLGLNIRVQCEDAETRTLLVANYGYMQGKLEAADLNYTVGRQNGAPAFFVRREGQEPLMASDNGEFLYLFEEDMEVELQRLRRDLYFVHSAALEFAGKAFMLVGTNGSGKSTTTWALLHHGFHYLSDELGPVDLKTLEVHPYPHALCLKHEPPGSYPLPEKTLYTSWTLHVPAEKLPGGAGRDPTPLAAIFFLHYGPEVSGPTIRPISKAEAGARLLANVLNALAHPGDGLDGAIKIATRSACFELFTADLPATCTLVKATLEGLLRG